MSTTTNFNCKTQDIPELYEGTGHYISAMSELKNISGTQGWYTIYELVVSPLKRIQIYTEYEATTYDAMLKTIYFAERGFRWNEKKSTLVLNSKPFTSVATENWLKRIGNMLADDRMTDGMYSETQQLLNFLRLK